MPYPYIVKVGEEYKPIIPEFEDLGEKYYSAVIYLAAIFIHNPQNTIDSTGKFCRMTDIKCWLKTLVINDGTTQKDRKELIVKRICENFNKKPLVIQFINFSNILT